MRPTGARLWRYRYRIAGKENLFAIGAYPEVSLASARTAREEARKLIKQGIHPSHSRKANRLQAAHEGANTFEAIAREWLDEQKRHLTPRAYRQRELLLEREAFPHIGALPMRQVTTAHVHAIIKRVAARAPQMAVIARQCIGAISRLAIVTMRGDIELSYALRESVRTALTQHKATLRLREIPAFFTALDSFPGHLATKAAVRLLWLTLARPSEAIGARWTEFDLANAVWTIPAARMKMRRAHSIPLPKQGVEMLTHLRAASGHAEFVVPNRLNPKKSASPTILAKAFASMGYAGKFSPHGVRATGRTILGEQGHPRDILERQLAHQDKKEVRAYDQGDRLEARRKVMQGWADYLDRLCAGGNVVNIGAKINARASA